jgi:pyruvate dehydrogenase E1 component alpha subunit/2-oxoisovalerate dehydrogenase E1 component alpha subunit
MARRMTNRPGCVGATCIGDGGTSTGAFHEALNQAAVEKLPLVLVIADNQYAYSTPTRRQYACASLADRASGYGVTGHTVDGTDLLACLKVLGQAVQQARTGAGPQMVVANLLRLCGHGEHDDAAYVDPKLRQSPVGRDCLQVAEAQLLKPGWLEPGQADLWRAEIQRQVEETVATVQREAAPDPFQENWTALSTKHLVETHPA